MKYYEIMSCPGYRITKTGEIWSDFSKRQLTVCIDKDGYRVVGLKPDNGKQRHKWIHRLLLETFVSPCPNGMECRHLNGDRQDNRLCNLKWGTRKENITDAVKHGTFNSWAKSKGERHGMVKLTWPIVQAIRALFNRGTPVTQTRIAEYFGVTPANISSIVNYKSWR